MHRHRHSYCDNTAMRIWGNAGREKREGTKSEKRRERIRKEEREQKEKKK